MDCIPVVWFILFLCSLFSANLVIGSRGLAKFDHDGGLFDPARGTPCDICLVASLMAFPLSMSIGYASHSLGIAK